MNWYTVGSLVRRLRIIRSQIYNMSQQNSDVIYQNCYVVYGHYQQKLNYFFSVGSNSLFLQGLVQIIFAD